MSDLVDVYDDVYSDSLKVVKSLDLASNEATTAMKNLRVLSECRPPSPTPDPEATPEPTTVAGKLKAVLAGVWDNETTRVLIKSGGALAGVALVTWTTVHRDHVVTREALSQANQRNS